MQYLATTNPGLESVGIEEVADLVGADATRRYRGTISFSADQRAVYELHHRSRTLHRIGLLLVDRPFEDLDHLAELVESLPAEKYADDGQAFGVRATRHGDHAFGSPDVGDVVGQAWIDAYRGATGHRLPVDLDDPEVILRAFVRNDRFYLALDLTGEISLHQRDYRICEHNSPLRPTLAASLVRMAGYEPGDRLLDPMCGSATIPTEAAVDALGVPTADFREGYAISRLPIHDPDLAATVRADHERRRERAPAREELAGTIRGTEKRERWVRCANENLPAAGVEDVVSVVQADATERPIDCDAVVSNLPFGIRTPVDLRDLYDGFSERLRAGSWDRAALLTTRPEFLDLEPTDLVDVRYGRLEVSVVVVDR